MELPTTACSRIAHPRGRGFANGEAERSHEKMMTTIQRIQEWYARQCNGDWEHSYGVKIDTLDNPGWWVKIELTGTDLEGKTFEAIQQGMHENGHPSEKDWICCTVKDNLFDGAGDSSKLEVILQTFLDWMDKNANQAMHQRPALGK